MSLRIRFTVVILIAANLFLAGYIVVVRSRQPATPAEARTAEKKLLPRIQLLDDRGQTFQSDQLLGTPLFVQFVNPNNRQQTDLVSAILKDRPKHPVKILLVTPNAQNLRASVPSITDDIIVVEKYYKELRSDFEIPDCCEKILLFDKTGTRVDQRFYYQGGALGKLHELVDAKPGYSPALFQKALASARSAQVESIRQRTLTSPSGKAVIVAFSLVGTFCPSGEFLDSLKAHQARLQDVEFLILFPKNFTPSDVQNFKTNLKVSMPVALADHEFSNVWEDFRLRYGEAAMNGAVVAIDRGAVSVLQGMDQVNSFLANAGNTNAKP
jgi:hypothetical protein